MGGAAHIAQGVRQGPPRRVPLTLEGVELGSVQAAQVGLNKTPGGWNTRKLLADQRNVQVSCRSEQICRTSCSSTGRMLCHGGAPIWTGLTVKDAPCLRSENVFRKKCPVKRNTKKRPWEDGVGGENWETRRGRSRAGLLRSPRDLHLDLATFGALQSLRIFDTLLALFGTAFATLGRKLAFQGSFGGIRHLRIFVSPVRTRVKRASALAASLAPRGCRIRQTR